MTQTLNLFDRVGPQSFAVNGFAIVPAVLSADECSAIHPEHSRSGPAAGSRCLLASLWCSVLARRLRAHPLLHRLIPGQHVAVQCTYFEKSALGNWLVPLHQDLSIPVAERVEEPSLTGWSRKEGSVFVHAPSEVLEQLVAVRLHIDTCTSRDGPLKVVPKSHSRGILGDQEVSFARDAGGEVVCEADQGAALVMRPLLLHSSSKSRGNGRRRVLHFLYGPRDLPNGLRWQTAV